MSCRSDRRGVGTSKSNQTDKWSVESNALYNNALTNNKCIINEHINECIINALFIV